MFELFSIERLECIDCRGFILTVAQIRRMLAAQWQNIAHGNARHSLWGTSGLLNDSLKT
jgi:hypothetical protein